MGIEDAVSFAKSKVGCGYVYGATGWICTPARRQQQAKQYPLYASTILTTCAKWDGKQCYDCAQLVRAAALKANVSLPSGATSQWKSDSWDEKGTIDTMPEEPGIILYRQSLGRMQHTEMYIGDGKTVGARSSKLGVNIFSFKGYSWTHWARLRKTEEEPGPKATVTGGRLRLRSGPGTSFSMILWMPDGATVSILDSTDDTWWKVKYNATTGYAMCRYLKEENDNG